MDNIKSLNSDATRNLILTKSVNVVARGVASIPYKVNVSGSEVKVHPVMRVFNNPSQDLGMNALLYQIAGFTLLTGKACAVLTSHDGDCVDDVSLLNPFHVESDVGASFKKEFFVNFENELYGSALSDLFEVFGVSVSADDLFSKASKDVVSWRGLDINWPDREIMSVADIALTFHVPPQLVGIPVAGGHQSMASARRDLWSQAIMPLANHIAGVWTKALQPFYGADVEILCDHQGVPLTGT